MGSKKEVGGSSEAWTGLLAVLGTLVGSPFQVSVGNREAQYLPAAEGGPAPSMDVCTVSLVLRVASISQNSETRPNMDVFTRESQCV